MINRRQTSTVILITLAELAWLAAFGLLFAYRSKVGELGNARRELDIATNRLAKWEGQAPDTADLLRRLDEANENIRRLQMGLRVFEKLLNGKSPEEAAQLLVQAETAEKRLGDSEKEKADLKVAYQERKGAITRMEQELRAATNELANFRQRMALMPPDAEQLATLWRDATNRIGILENQLAASENTNNQISAALLNREVGEFSVRGELTGIPSGDLRRVIFVVDTSSSMRNSPAWDSARKLMRTWMEYLSVEECVLVNFNDTAFSFPATQYQRVRETNGLPLSEKRKELLAAFDEARPGIYSDMLKGLRVAYSFPKPDLIVMFTDGHPHIATSTDSKYAAQILKESAMHPGIPILTVAVGSYEVEGAGGPRERANPAIAFLKRLAERTGGSFIGR